MAVLLETTIKRFTGLSTDSKPTGIQPGSYFWCYDTNILWKTYDGDSWVTHTVKSITQPSVETMSFHQAAADYPLFTCAGGAVLIENFTLTNTIDISSDGSCDSDNSCRGGWSGSCAVIGGESLYLLDTVCSLCGAAYQLLGHRSHD
jgi:hypothetical protein